MPLTLLGSASDATTYHSSNTPTSTHSATHETVAGTTLLIATAGCRQENLSAAYFDTDALVEAISHDAGAAYDIAIYYMINPPIGSHLFELDCTTDSRAKFTVQNWAGNLNSTDLVFATHGTDGTSSNPSYTIAGASGYTAIDTIMSTTSDVGDFTVGSDQTLGANVVGDLYIYQLASSYELGTSTDITMSWLGTSQGHLMATAVFKPAPALNQAVTIM